MQFIQFDHLVPYIPNIGQTEAELIHGYWRAFDEHPDQFKDTDLPNIITEWLKEELPKWERDERGALCRKRYHYKYGYVPRRYSRFIPDEAMEYGTVEARDNNEAMRMARSKIPDGYIIRNLTKVDNEK